MKEPTVLESLGQVWKWIRWTLFGPKPAVCCVCGDALIGEDEVRQKHCRVCWPAVLRHGRPPIVSEPMRPLGKASSR